ncbi:D-alanyl-D-alanine carboxypeptidase 1 [Clostridium bornimense]|uniref:D-alanyl-D-alanine carboxypeptidase 1 n=1 Tax=Clostridium bornimense TaxID=1216932 RepID=W6SE59_9CLOT|nr:D-alanyl-D-alanine carboxypeptidase family protein [Clostridium bornimense]CDM67905.1 D-alanyl-D-alanine carboxypeptidase 1 [Clostridium bornimense]
MKIKSILLSVILVSATILNPIQAKANTIKYPEIESKYAITVDVDTGDVIYSKNAEEKAFPASITKLMTALILTENTSPTDTIEIEPYTLEQEPSALYEYTHLTIGQKLTAEEALNCILIASTNDIAETIATNIPTVSNGDTSQFIEMMNKKAKELNMKNTHFVTASGLDTNTSDHQTTAYDISLLAREAYKVPEILAASKIPSYVHDFGNGEVRLRNTNRFINGDYPDLTDSTCIASKTGFTDKAGRCLTSLFERNGRKMLGVVLFAPSSEASFTDMKSIIDYSYEAKKSIYSGNKFNSSDSVEFTTDASVGSIDVKYKVFKTFGPEKTKNVDLYIKDNVEIYNNDFNTKNTTVKYSIDADVFRKNNTDPIGSIIINEKENSIEIPVYSSVYRDTILTENESYYSWFRIIKWSIVILTIVVIISIISIVYLFKNKKRNRNKSKYIINKQTKFKR